MTYSEPAPCLRLIRRAARPLDTIMNKRNRIYPLLLMFGAVCFIIGLIGLFVSIDPALASIIEVMSSIGILALVIRIRQHPIRRVDNFSAPLSSYGLGILSACRWIISHRHLQFIHWPQTDHLIESVAILLISISVIWVLVRNNPTASR